MIKVNIFQKYLFLIVISIVSFVFLGFYFFHFLVRTFSSIPESLVSIPPPISIAKMIDRLNSNNKVEAIKEYLELNDSLPMPSLILVRSNGEVIFPDNVRLPFDWNQIRKPKIPYTYTVIKMRQPKGDNDGEAVPSDFRVPLPPPPLFPGGHLSPPRMGAGPFPYQWDSHLIRLKGNDEVFLYIQPPLRPFEKFKGNLPKPPSPWLGLISLLLSLVLGVVVALLLIYRSVNKNVLLADEVITQLQKGNLKARFPVKRRDEFGQAMIRFNLMAEEIEKLVEHLKAVEGSRTKLLQELAHDLRTPIASLKNCLGTLNLSNSDLDPRTSQELLNLSLQETEYFERLVEDLLFLSQVSEPNYHSNRKKINLGELVQTELDQVIAVNKQLYPNIILKDELFEENCFLIADSYLLKRLIRNLVDNAFAYAKNTVVVACRVSEDDEIELIVEDDGIGFDSQTLEHYGERRFSRKMIKDKNGKLSIGLGAVVIRAVCAAHCAKLNVGNKVDRDNNVIGAKVSIFFARSI